MLHKFELYAFLFRILYILLLVFVDIGTFVFTNTRKINKI
jgi:hypothetical protein